MPTGYTCDIEKGISFKEYALICARAFGALMHLRDNSLNSDIPEEIEPNEYHLNMITETQVELNKIKKMTLEEVEEKANDIYNNKIKEYKKSVKRDIELTEKYNKMLLKVNNYRPPSDDHIELKKFMSQQIKESIKFDCNYTHDTPYYINGKDWKKEQESSLLEDLTYHRKKYEKEKERINNSNNWIKLLVESLEEK